MNWFKKLSSSSSGPIWESLNEESVSPVLVNADAFDEPMRSVVRRVVLSSFLTTDFLFSPAKDTAPLINIDVKRLSCETLLLLHRSIMWTLVALYYSSNPELKTVLAEACAESVGCPDSTEEENRLDAIEVTGDLAPIAARLFSRICNVVGVPSEDPADRFRFAMVFGEVYAGTVESLDSELSK